jgi:hypothetical protein
VQIKCVDLTLGDTADTSPKHRTPLAAGRMIPTSEALPLRAAPDSARPVWMVQVDRGSPLELERMAVRGGWTKVFASWSDGTRIAGWTERTNVAWFDGEFGEFVSGIGVGGCGIAVCVVYHGPAILHGGASVHASPDGPIWARAAESTRVVVVGKSDWVQLAEVPGLGGSNACTRLENAYVRADDLTYPP